MNNKRKALLRKTDFCIRTGNKLKEKHSWNRAEIRIVLKGKRFRNNTFDIKQRKTTTTLPFRVSLSQFPKSPPKFVWVQKNIFSSGKCKFSIYKHRQRVWYFPRKFTWLWWSLHACFVKKVLCKRVSLRRDAWRLWKLRQNRRRCKKSKACQKNNDWENSMFLLTSCQGWWRYQSNWLLFAIYGEPRHGDKICTWPVRALDRALDQTYYVRRILRKHSIFDQFYYNSQILTMGVAV